MIHLKRGAAVATTYAPHQVSNSEIPALPRARCRFRFAMVVTCDAPTHCLRCYSASVLASSSFPFGMNLRAAQPPPRGHPSARARRPIPAHSPLSSGVSCHTREARSSRRHTPHLCHFVFRVSASGREEFTDGQKLRAHSAVRRVHGPLIPVEFVWIRAVQIRRVAAPIKVSPMPLHVARRRVLGRGQLISATRSNIKKYSTRG